jgi:hypothetical protein
MLWAIILVSIPSALLGGYVLLSGWRRRRTPPELRGDWWQQFEREFRAYVASSAGRSANARGQVKRQQSDRGTPPPH